MAKSVRPVKKKLVVTKTKYEIDEEEVGRASDARHKLMAGVLSIKWAVAAGMGPAGEKILTKEDGPPRLTKRADVLAGMVREKSALGSLGAGLLQDGIFRTHEQVGDGGKMIAVSQLEASLAGNNPYFS